MRPKDKVILAVLVIVVLGSGVTGLAFLGLRSMDCMTVYSEDVTGQFERCGLMEDLSVEEACTALGYTVYEDTTYRISHGDLEKVTTQRCIYHNDRNGDYILKHTYEMEVEDIG